MGRRFQEEEFDRLLKKLMEKYRLYGPKRYEGIGTYSGTDILRYGEILSFDELVHSKKTDYSPKEVYFPITQTLMHFINGDIIEAKDEEEKGAILFLRPCDINSLRSLDHVFLENGTMLDPYYKKKRERLRIFMLECREGFDSCFCVSMGANRSDTYDAALRFLPGEVWMTEGRPSENGMEENSFRGELRHLMNELGETIDFEPEFVKENKVKVEVPELEKITMEHFEDGLWNEYTKRCIACGRCNFVCPTCSCWTMQDASYEQDGKIGERRRVWGSCHVDGYTDMAGGHSFRRTNGERMRFKVFHKVYDFRKRFGENMCVGCGRCDDICPEYISYSNSINKLTALTQKPDGKEDEKHGEKQSDGSESK